jgi:hypothetical protein
VKSRVEMTSPAMDGARKALHGEGVRALPRR